MRDANGQFFGAFCKRNLHKALNNHSLACLCYIHAIADTINLLLFAVAA